MYLGTDSEGAIYKFAEWLNQIQATKSELWQNMNLVELAIYYIEHQREMP